MNQLINSNQITMSSREIAALLESRHRDVCVSISRLMDSGAISGYAATPYTHEQNQQTYFEYLVSKRDSYVIVAQMSPAFTAALVDRWQELEEQQKSKSLSIPDFTDPYEAAIAWAAQYKEKQALSLINKQQEAEINQLHTLFNEGMTPSQFAKKLNGVNCQKINEFLMDKNWLRSGKHDWRVTSYARDRYLTEKETQIIPEDKPSFIKYQPTLLRAGAVRLFSLYTKGKLPMKKSWDGLFTHDKSIEVAV